MTQKNKTLSPKRDLTQGAIVSHIMRMSIPMTIGIGAIISVALVDAYFVSILGGEALAAMGYAYPVMGLLFNIVFGMAIAMSAVASRRIGEKKKDEVREVFIIGVAMVALLTISLSILCLVFSDFIYGAMGANNIILPKINEYMNIWVMGAVFLAIPVVCNAAIRANGDSVSPAIIMSTIAIVNLILDPIFIFGLFGFPQMALAGAAWASVTAYIIATLAAMGVLIYRENMVDVRLLIRSCVWKRSLRALIVIALPVSIANSILPIVSYVHTAFLSSLGQDYVAGFGVLTRLEAFALIPVMAIAAGISPVVGQNYGAEKYDRVSEAITKAIKFSVFYSLICAFIMALLSHVMAQAFSDNSKTIDFIMKGLVFIPLSYLGVNIFLIVTSAMNALGQAKTALVLNMIRAFILMIPLAWIGIYLYQSNGFIASFVLCNVIIFVMALYCLRRLDCFQFVNAIPLLSRHTKS